MMQLLPIPELDRANPGTEAFVERWSREGPGQLRENHALFRDLTAQAQVLLAKGDLAAAAAWCEIAGFHAATSHSGIFASPQLEATIRGIAHGVFGDAPIARRQAAGRRRRVLHVATYAHPIGGLTRMIWRWIEADGDSLHSVALIRQRRAVPTSLVKAVGDSGGTIHNLCQQGAETLFGLARSLREAARDADIVVLHVDTRDIVPMLAFASASARPAIAYLDHADHHMWVGASIADVVIALRRSGADLAVARRGIEAARSVLLPIPVVGVERALARSEAKARLGMAPDGLLLLSVARAVKYRTVDGLSFADAHVNFLMRHPDARLVVLGSGARDDWRQAQARVPGRIIGLPESDETALYYDAADIYVDSFPFISTTSLLEGACHGLPLVTRYPFGPGGEILGADMPGLDGHLIQARDLTEYEAALDRLAANGALREGLGARTRDGVAAFHGGASWTAALRRIYHVAAHVEPVRPSPAVAEEVHPGAPDVFIPYVHGKRLSRDELVCSQLALMPARMRFSHWLRLTRRHGLAFGGRRDLLKCWVPSRMVALMRG